jgi:transposase
VSSTESPANARAPDRRARRAKSDRLDLAGLLNLLARYQQGDRRGWRVVRVPSVAEEDGRHLHRTRETIQQERTRVINRLRGLLTTQGLALPIQSDFLTRLETAPRSRPTRGRGTRVEIVPQSTVPRTRSATASAVPVSTRTIDAVTSLSQS